jgi:hypothetical protein
MGSSSSHRNHGWHFKTIKGLVRGKVEEPKEEENKWLSVENSAVKDRKKYTEYEDDKVYKLEDYDYIYPMMRERNQKSFYTPKSKRAGIKHPNIKLPSLEELDKDSPDSQSSVENNMEEGEPNELNSTEISTIHQSKRQKYKNPSRRQSEDMTDVSSFMDLVHARRRPKTKLTSNKNLVKLKNLSKKASGEYNEILDALKRWKHGSSSEVISLLKDNRYALKTALIAPVENADQLNYKYSIEEELFGLLLVVTNKNIEIFEYLWDSCGAIWNDNHLIPLISEMVGVGWCKGIKKLFGLKRTQEMFFSMNPREKKYFYEDLADICECNLSDNSDKRRVVVASLLKCLTKRPYATLSFLLLFKYIHELSIKVKTKEITLEGCNGDFYVLLNDPDALFDLAIEFNSVWCDSLNSLRESTKSLNMHGLAIVKSKYHKIIHKLIHLSLITEVEAINISGIWESIRVGDIGEFKYLIDESKRSWPILLTLQDKYGDWGLLESTENESGIRTNVCSDSKLRKLKPQKWKPLHYMIYYDRIEMFWEFLQFWGKHVHKALTVHSKKHKDEEDLTVFKLAIKHGSKHTFFNLWKMPFSWSIKHLYCVVRLLRKYLDETKLKIVLKSQTTKDILLFASEKVKISILKEIEDLIEDKVDSSTERNKMMKYLKKLERI